MSSGSQGKRVEMLAALKRELRKSSSFGASFFRVAATQTGLAADTDIQVLDLLDLTGEASAGQLAELTGMTSGAIAKVLNRLEASGLVQRERDKSDGRRVIVRLAQGQEALDKVRAILASLEETWDDVVSSYGEEELALLFAFLQRSNTLARQRLAELQTVATVAPDERNVFSAPLDDLSCGRLVVSSAGIRLVLRTEEGLTDLYQARFEGAVPTVTVQDGVVTIRYPRRFLILTGEQRQAVITLNRAIPWQIAVQSGGSDIIADLGDLELTSCEIRGVGSRIHVELPVPSGVIPVRLGGGGAEMVVRRPAGIAIQVHLKGWGSACTVDGQTHFGNNLWLQSAGFDPTAPCYYSLEVVSSGGMVTITSH
ncbi:MarR family winged helix-turn-helix transcriptional regulator [Thermogemmatispora carboxidivorans]|uniref:MarR family winged helix-turn-helix transcriptional regulator n=1 Tax=Thermogemmatispora carboxidivorans TaxID=1382306 RepID=UPI0009DF11F9|nr:MarR family winged helix-turn-helix transcriptional regulator [Thermogemmatispora carboxidivorans]